MSKTVYPMRDDLYWGVSSKGYVLQTCDNERKLKAIQCFNHLFKARNILRDLSNQTDE